MHKLNDPDQPGSNSGKLAIDRRSALGLIGLSASMGMHSILWGYDASVMDFHVSPEGEDVNLGTRGQPLHSLAEAQRRVRSARANGTAGTIAISLHHGTHLMTETIVFDTRDTGPGSPLIVRAEPDSHPVLSSGVPVKNWRLAGRLPEAPEASVGKVWVAELPAQVRSANVVADQTGMLHRARTPAFTHADRLEDWVGTNAQHSSVRILEKERLKNSLLPSKRGAQVRVIGTAPWTMNYLSVRSVSGGRIRFFGKSTYAMAAPRFYMPADSVYLENTFAGLLQPGSWVIDHKRRKIYLWPTTSEPQGIVVPTLNEFIRVEGTIMDDQLHDVPVTNVHFTGITFSHGKRFEFSGRTGLGLQHDWERFDAPTALLRFRGAENCTVSHCAFEHSGGTGVRVDLHGQKIAITHNRFEKLGACAVLMAGYGPGAKDVNCSNQIKWNTIKDIGLVWNHCCAIWAWQSGSNDISNNMLSHLPYSGICVTGRINMDRKGQGEASRSVRWSEIEPNDVDGRWEEREKYLHARNNSVMNNDISHVIEKINDGNGIYVSGAGGGNVIKGNHIHDCPTELAGEAIRCDDDQNETSIERNIIYKFGAYGTGVCSKGRNNILANIIIFPIGKVVRGLISIETADKSEYGGSRIQNNILIADKIGQNFIFRDVISQIPRNDAERIQIDRNIYYNVVDPNAVNDHFEWSRSFGFDKFSTGEDPGIIGVTTEGPLLAPRAAARRLGW